MELRLHQDVIGKLKVRVESENPLPAAEAPAGEGRRDDARTDRRGRRPEAAPEKAEAGDKKARPARAERPARPEKAAKGGKTS